MSSWLAVEYAVIRWQQATQAGRVTRVHGALGPALQQATALADSHPADIITIARQEVLRFGWDTDVDDLNLE